VINRLSGERQKEMGTEVHRCGQGEYHQHKNTTEIDKELNHIREKIERLKLKMQLEEKARWTYEWPFKRKDKWHVQKLLSRRKQKMLKRWPRHAENLSDKKEELVFICELEVGKTLNEEEGQSIKGLINCQEGRDEFSYFEVGNEIRSIEDLIDWQEGNS
jgi:hypothetical protein